MDENIGKKYNKLKAVKYDHKGKYNEKYYLFKCDCGKEKVINLSNVKTGKTKSCGCNYKLSGYQKKYNIYEIKNDYIIGHTTNTNKEFLIDKEDYNKIKKLSWYEQKNGYVCHKDTRKKIILLHRFIMNCPKNKIVDHINHNKKDNRKQNLRITNYSINSLNRKKIPNGISKTIIDNNIYYIVQLKTYRGCFKNYNDAKKLRDKIIKNEYLPIRRNYL